MMRYQKRRRLIIFSFLVPAFLFYGVFILYPAIQTFYVSFFQWSGASDRPDAFIGLTNFIQLFADYRAIHAIYNSLLFIIVLPPITLILALLLAQVLNSRLYGTGFFEIVFFIPSVVPLVVIGILGCFIYNPSFGLLNSFLRVARLGRLARPWLGLDNTVTPSIIIVKAWSLTGLYIIIFLAEMKNIPIVFYEAAKLDGAGGWQEFWYITLPLVWEVLRIALVLVIVNAVQAFTLVWVMTEGGPNGASELLSTYMFKNAFAWSKMGYGAAIAVVMFVMLLAINFFFYRVVLKRASIEF